MVAFLFFFQLYGVAGKTRPRSFCPLYAGRIIALYDCTFWRKAPLALQKELSARPPTHPAFCVQCSCHNNKDYLYSPDLFRSAAVMRDWSDILDACHRKAMSIERSHCSLSSGTDPFHENNDFCQSIGLHFFRCIFYDHRCCIRRRLLRSPKTAHSRRRPSEHIPIRIRKRHNSVVEGSLNMDTTDRYVLCLFLPLSGRRFFFFCFLGSCHRILCLCQRAFT